MTKFESPSFSVFPGSEKNYRDNYDRIFGKKADKPDPWGAEREVTPKTMSDLPEPRNAQSALESKPKKAKKKRGAKNEKAKKKSKAKKAKK